MHLREVFSRIRLAGLKLKLPKCIFSAPSVKCLGNIVSEEGVTVDPEKVSAIVSLAAPTNVKAVKSFLGMTAFYARLIEDYAIMAAPLDGLTHKGVVFSAECTQGFKASRQALSSEPVLRLPDWTTVTDENGRPQLLYPFQLTTDWSQTAMGAVLSQPDADGNDHPIAYASRLLTPAETRFAPSEGECCALTWAFQKFRHYLHGYHCYIFTDHQAFNWLNVARFQNAKLERWALKLQEYNFTVEFCTQECEIVVADCLSRLKQPEALAQVFSVWPTEAQTQAELDSIPCEVCYDSGDGII